MRILKYILKALLMIPKQANEKTELNNYQSDEFLELHDVCASDVAYIGHT